MVGEDTGLHLAMMTLLPPMDPMSAPAAPMGQVSGIAYIMSMSRMLAS